MEARNEKRREQFEERLQENIPGATAGWLGLNSAAMETAKVWGIERPKTS